MKLKNNAERAYIAFATVIKAGETIETKDQKVIDILLNQPGVEEFVDKSDIKKIEKENEELKEELKEVKKTITKKTTKKSCK